MPASTTEKIGDFVAHSLLVLLTLFVIMVVVVAIWNNVTGLKKWYCITIHHEDGPRDYVGYVTPLGSLGDSKQTTVTFTTQEGKTITTSLPVDAVYITIQREVPKQ